MKSLLRFHYAPLRGRMRTMQRRLGFISDSRYAPSTNRRSYYTILHVRCQMRNRCYDAALTAGRLWRSPASQAWMRRCADARGQFSAITALLHQPAVQHQEPDSRTSAPGRSVMKSEHGFHVGHLVRALVGEVVGCLVGVLLGQPVLRVVIGVGNVISGGARVSSRRPTGRGRRRCRHACWSSRPSSRPCW